MSNPALVACKYAIAGVVVGGTSAYFSDFLYGQAMKMMPKSFSQDMAGLLGRAAFDVVGATSLAALMIYGGDQIMDQIGGQGEDPLYRLFFYQVAFHSQGVTKRGPAAVRAIWSQIMGSVASGSPCNKPGGCGQ